MKTVAHETSASTTISAPSDTRYRCRIELLLFLSVHTGPLHLVRSTGAGGSEEQLLTVRQRQVAAVSAVGAILRLISVDHDRVAHFQRVLGDAATKQDVRASGFDGPVLNFAIGALHVHMDPAMRIDQLDFRDRGFLKLNRLGPIEFGRERMMRPDLRLGQKQCDADDDRSNSEFGSHNGPPDFHFPGGLPDIYRS